MRPFKNLFPAFALLLPTLSAAQVYHTSYTVNRPDNADFEITNILLLERDDQGSGTTWPFRVDYGSTSTTLTNPFDLPRPPAQSLLVGLAHDLPNDAPGQEHVVLMMDDEAASLSNHIAWGTLFRNTLEENLIDDIKLATSGQDWDIIQPGLDGLGTFAFNDADNGILGPGGVSHTAWFTTGGSFTVMSFSDGAIIGTGTSSVQAVPEPASLAAIGVGLATLARRRRK